MRPIGKIIPPFCLVDGRGRRFLEFDFRAELEGYFLNPLHRHGRHKARVFESARSDIVQLTD